MSKKNNKKEVKESKKVENWWLTWLFYWKFAGPVFKKIRWVYLLLMPILVAALVEPTIYKKVVDGLAVANTQAINYQEIINLLLIWVGISVVNLILSSIYRLVFSYYTPDIERSYTDYFYEKILHKDVKMHLEKKSGELMKDVDRAADFFWMISSVLHNDMLLSWCTFLVTLIYALTVSWQMTLVMLAVFPIYVLIFGYVSFQTSDLQAKSFDQYSEAYGNAYDAMNNIVVVKAFAKEKIEHHKFLSLIAKAAHNQRFISMRWGGLSVVQYFLSISIRLAIFLGGVLLMQNGVISVGTIIMFLAFSGPIYGPIQQLGYQLRDIQRAGLTMEKARKILESKNDIEDLPEAKDLKVKEGRIALEAAKFSYKDIGVIKDVSFVVEPGTMTALVGHSGAGKSTLTSLINRFYDLSAGRILIDGQNIAEVTQKSLRENIGLVMQDNSMFNDTIINNIRYGKPKATLAEVRKAAKMANIDDFIMNFPDKYETKVGERGLKLSGGERQRVAIARVVLKNPPILILDEATSALDSKNEQIIQEALERLMKGRTSIVIAHRLSTVRKADAIVVMDKGRIVQMGKHSELSAKKGLYKELVDLQVKGLLAE